MLLVPGRGVQGVGRESVHSVAPRQCTRRCVLPWPTPPRRPFPSAPPTLLPSPFSSKHLESSASALLLPPGVNMCEAAVWVDEWPMAGCGALVWKAVASSAQLLD